MGQNLVIVESPAKAKTIGKYLGKNYIVEASMGHVRDLPKSQLGVDIENNYDPKYITIRGKGELLDKLRKLAKKSDKVYLATDPDREGEAISWHLATALKIDKKDKCRIEFNEITKTAVKNSIKNSRTIDEDLVDAQQARRVLDRLVGYEISPILWRNVKWGLSAGRVQSAALHLICDREAEIEKFIPKEYWSIECSILKEKIKFPIKLTGYNNKKIEIKDEQEANNIIEDIKSNDFKVEKIKKSLKNKNPLPPFTTSTLQQEAYKKINFATKKTMSVAQQLYEGVEIKGYGTIGLITYMRTDSVRISEEAQGYAMEFIESTYGKDYLPKEPRVYKSKKNIQDAHEAIRPSDINITPEKVKASLKPEQYKLYLLIWNRYVGSQMSSCILNTISVEVKNGDYTFRASGSSIKFEGFMKVYDYAPDTEEENTKIPELIEDEILKCCDINPKQHFTQPLARYTEASFVKTMEENGIGRPSTYVPTISTLFSRKYIDREKKNLLPTDLGKIVNDIMEKYFKQIVDIEFTAAMENKLDSVEEGTEPWKEVVDEFFKPLKESIDIAEKEICKITIEDEVSEVPCDKCGKLMVIKHGRFGKFLACPAYPECKNTKAIVEELKAPCPKCGGILVAKRSKKGNRFYGCSSYPECDFISWFEPSEKKCIKCGTFMYKKYSKSKGNYLECSNVECKFKEIIEKQAEE
ncbi:DNA topoisomerase I [Clostridium putrefaciens]|uniref:DNA topoisomerase 1 n=1 Tax=Clostridium putrefaciens TaxID=99675 RepID=A0A381J7M4_9CLOT|nr:type I DNA topoisomerase [Clostridium putrefaciens]SUY47260.1 DNA topoisomerase I [Clostridium putrefaciens]